MYEFIYNSQTSLFDRTGRDLLAIAEFLVVFAGRTIHDDERERCVLDRERPVRRLRGRHSAPGRRQSWLRLRDLSVY